MRAAMTRFQIPYWFDTFGSLSTPMLLLIVAAGVIFLLYGRVVFKLTVMINAAVAGAYIGAQMGLSLERPRLFAIGMAVAFALLAWPLLKVSVATFVGLIGTALAVAVLTLVTNDPTKYSLPVAAGGFIVFAVVGWRLFGPAVIAFTAIQGSAMILLSSLAWIEQLPAVTWNVRAWALAHDEWLWGMILVLALLGVLYQGQMLPKPPAAPPAEGKQVRMNGPRG